MPLDRLRVFLCHAHDDKPTVWRLYQQLQTAGFDPWLDSENILPGQDWEVEIREAVQHSDVVLVCLSHKAVSERGFRHKEIKFALDLSDEQPEGTIYLIPTRLEECDVPSRLQRWNWVDLFAASGFEKLRKALDARALDLGISSALSIVDLLVLNWVDTQKEVESEEVEDERQSLEPTSLLSSRHLRMSEHDCLWALRRLRNAGYLIYRDQVDASNTSLYHCCWEVSQRGTQVLADFTNRIGLTAG